MHICIGRVITDAHPHGAYFLESAGVGLSALAVPLGQAAEKGRWAKLLGKLGAFVAFKGAHVAIVCDDGDVLEAETEVVTLSNAPLFGKEMLVAPEACMDDGLFDFLAIAGGKRVDEPRVFFRRVHKVRISADAAMKANADLEVLAEQPSWEIAVVPRAISTVIGSGAALTLRVDAAPSAVPDVPGAEPASAVNQ